MGLLDQVIGGVLGQVLGGGREPERGGHGGGQGSGGLGGAMSPIVQALLMLLMSKGAGGLGDLLGGGRHHEAPAPRHGDDGDIGGFGQDPRGPSGGGSDGGWDRRHDADRAEPASREGDFSDLSGMLDGPGDRAGGGERDPGAGSEARRDGGPGDGHGGLDGLIDRFQSGGLGDVMESWIGHGENRPVAPDRLADALGPDTVDTLAQRTSLNRDDLLAQLAQALPQVINGLTPQGRRPTGEDQRGW
ncbi:YidB family protein [Methylobacterium sp. J-068]|uniref:YidB family protein n=1 Tax=Methylobacterium sp. J-068 TaxID=2836649 RepID=UPI001FB97380|nr:YidB family protein [Methylobacterium sp. J-068]MCJ2034683.1 YidB family protein [Methylobacterium sp. J-068]